MTGRHRAAGHDPLDDTTPSTLHLSQNTDAERNRARDTVTRYATSLADQHQLLTALGLDNADEIATQLANCHQQGDAG